MRRSHRNVKQHSRHEMTPTQSVNRRRWGHQPAGVNHWALVMHVILLFWFDLGEDCLGYLSRPGGNCNNKSSSRNDSNKNSNNKSNSAFVQAWSMGRRPNLIRPSPVTNVAFPPHVPPSTTTTAVNIAFQNKHDHDHGRFVTQWRRFVSTRPTIPTLRLDAMRWSRRTSRLQIRPVMMAGTSTRSVGLNETSNDGSAVSSLSRLKRRLTREFITIGGPALVQLAAEPIAALVDTAYLGRLGPDILGGAGVAVSAQYAVGKLYNDPLLRTSISLVAAQDGKSRMDAGGGGGGGGETNALQAQQHQKADKNKKDLSVAVSSALLLAGTVGLIQGIVFATFCRAITVGMGVSSSSPMWYSAISYLQVRAFGTPAATLWLVANGIFRGLGDTTTPLVYSLAFTALNAILDPIFIFTFGWGASGAAAGTALAQYAALIPLLRALHRKVSIDVIGQVSDLGTSLRQYVQAGGLVLFRTVGKVLAYSICARQAALLGSVAAAAYNMTFQLGFATTQVCEAVAVAVQTLLAREMADQTSHPPAIRAALIRHLIQTSIWMGGSVAIILSITTYARRDWILAGLTTNADIRQAAAAIFPVVLLTQVLKGLAYPTNGIIMGGLDWFFSMIVMWVANVVCVGLLRYFGRSGEMVSLNQIWLSLAAFMAVQVITSIARYESKTGVWKILQTQDTNSAVFEAQS